MNKIRIFLMMAIVSLGTTPLAYGVPEDTYPKDEKKTSETPPIITRPLQILEEKVKLSEEHKKLLEQGLVKVKLTYLDDDERGWGVAFSDGDWLLFSINRQPGILNRIFRKGNGKVNNTK